MSALVSIIIPVYNVEQYIKKCIQSVLDQTYKNFEVIIVNDGSPDNSIEIAKSLVGGDSRFIFLEKDNGGQGTARNLALDHANGDYIAFLDSDDYYDKEYLSVMTKKIIDDNADICICNLNIVDTKGNITGSHKNNLSLYLSKQDYLLSYRSISNYMWDKLFKVACFDEFRFDPTIRTYEDVHLLFRIIYNKDITSVDDRLYNYVQRPGSTMNSLPKTYIDDRQSIYLEIKKFYQETLNSDKRFKKHLIHHFLNNFMFDCSTNIARYSNHYKRDINNLLSKDKDNILTFNNIILSKDLPRNNKLALLLLKSNPYAHNLLMSTWLKIKSGEQL